MSASGRVLGGAPRQPRTRLLSTHISPAPPTRDPHTAGCKAVTTACCQKPHKPEPTPINANAADAAFTTKAAAALASQV